MKFSIGSLMLASLNLSTAFPTDTEDSKEVRISVFDQIQFEKSITFSVPLAVPGEKTETTGLTGSQHGRKLQLRLWTW